MSDLTSIRLVRSDGAELSLSINVGGWTIESESLEGWDELSLTVNTAQNVFDGGSSLVSRRINEKDRTASAFYTGSASARQARREAESFFNPNYAFKAYVAFGGITRWVEGQLYAFKCDIEPYGVPRLTFTILSLDPYWHDPEGNFVKFGTAVGAFGFPFVSHVREVLPKGERHPVGFRASVLLFDGVGNVYNDGDVPTYYTVRIRARGDLVRPCIAKDGRFVRYMGTLSKDDELVIDFTASPPTMRVNGKSVINRADRASSFTKMAMQVGKNEFRFSVDNVENRSLADVYVEHYERYLGV